MYRLLLGLSKRYENAMCWAGQHERIVLLGVFTVALLIRVLYMILFVGLDSPPTFDGVAYDRFAIQIAEGEGYHTDLGPTASKPPLYPFFVAGVYSLFGFSNFAAIRLVQVLLDSLSCVLVYSLGKSWGGSHVGILASVGAMLYPLSMYMDAQLYPEILFSFLLVSMLFFSLKMVRSDQVWAPFSCGVLLGLSILARPNILGLLPFVVLYPFLLQSRLAALRTAFALLFAVFLVMLPWSVRNYLVFHEFVPLTTEGGGVFWADNNPLADGGTVIPTRETWQGDDYPDRLWSGWSNLSESESSRKFLQAGLTWIKSNPTDFLMLIPRKLARLWSPVSFTTQSDRSTNPLVTLLWIPFVAFLSLVVTGIVASIGKWRLWFMAYALIVTVNLTTVLFAGGTRYAIPMAPALILFSGMGFAAISERWLPSRVD